MFKIASGPQHLQGRKLYINQDWQEKLAEFGLTLEADWMALAPGEIASGSKRVNAYKVALQNGQTVYFKHYSFHGQYMDYFMRRSKCAIEVDSYQILKQIGIPTIEPLAFGEDRLLGMLKSCCIVTLGITDTQQLEDFAFKKWRHLPKEEKKIAFNDIFLETAKFTAMAHKANFFHYDLKWRNILIRKEGNNYRTIWIDCPRGQVMKIRNSRGQMVDLSCLARLALSYLSKSQRMRFLKVYLEYLGTNTSIKDLWRRVDSHLSRRPPVPVDFSEN